MTSRFHPFRRACAALLTAGALSSCSRCGHGGSTTSADTATADDRSSDAPKSSSDTVTSDANAGDVPEVKDAGPGRATAALRAALKAYGIAYNESTLSQDCKVNEEGASIDDLEDVANRLGLDAKQIVLPKENVLLPESKVLPGITILETADGDRDFVLLWKRDGDRIMVMDPNAGRGWVNQADIARRLYVEPEVTVSASDWAAAEAAPAYRDALRARLVQKGVSRDFADKRLGLSDPSVVGALDAIVRQIETDPTKAGTDVESYVDKELGCELNDKCDGATRVPDDLWTARPAGATPDSPALVHVRGAVMLVISGKKAP